MSFSDLSIKQLNQIIRAKATQLSPEKSKFLLQQRAAQYEKVGLISLCTEHIDPSEIEKLLVPVAATSASSSSTNSSASGSNTDSTGMGQMANMTPDQLRQQANAMRQNPGAFRHMQTPSLTDDQILQAAAQMETMASNPAMLQQMKEQMAKMSPADIEKMRKQQQGQGQYRSSSAGSSAGQPQDNTDQEIASLMRMLEGDPAQARAFIKSQPGFGGLTDEMVDQQLDTLRKLDPAMLKTALGYIKPLSGYYQQLDAKTGGRGKYVLIAVFLLLTVLGLYLAYLSWGFFWTCWGYIFGSSTPSISSTAASGSESLGDTGTAGLSATIGSEKITARSAGGSLLGGHNDENDEFEF